MFNHTCNARKNPGGLWKAYLNLSDTQREREWERDPIDFDRERKMSLLPRVWRNYTNILDIANQCSSH